MTRKSSEESNAPRRRLAGAAAEQPAGCATASTRLQVSACGRSAWRPSRSGCRLCCRHGVRVRPASGVQCPVRASGVPRVPVHVTGVRCGRLSVQCPVSGPRRPCVRRPLCPTGMRSRGVAVGPPAARLGWPGSAWSPAMSMTARPLPEVRVWRSKLAQARAGPAEGRLGLGRRRGRWLAVGKPTGRGWMRARFAHRRLQLAVTTLRGHGVRPGPGSAGR